MVKGRRWRMRVSMGALASAALLTTLLIEPASAAPEACSYDAGTRTITATIASGGQATLLVVGGELHFGATPTACGAATTTNTDSLVVNGEAGTNETLVLDHRGGPFGPGFTQEFNTGEIEMTFAFGDSTDKLIIYGTDGDDHMAAGQSGIALNSDGDVDITITPAAFLLEAHMLLGADFFNGGGEGGAGLHFLGSITLHGGPGSDTGLRGGEGPDFVYGGDGNDAINTHDGIDVLDGGPGNDTLQSGSGDDSLTGGSGLDTFTAAAGNDVMYAQDDEADTQLHGGQGTDTAHVDSGVDPRPVATETVIGDGGPPPPPSGSCTYNATTKVVTASIPAGQQGTLIVVGEALHFGSTPAACGAATTTNTDSIAVSGGSGTIETLVLDLSGGAYAPGAAAEADTPEIELTTALGDATDVVIVRGGPGNDTLRIGTTGMALNADGDRDVTLSPHPAQVELIGGGGVNTLSANGGFGTGSTYLGKAILRAGDAGDLVTGGNGNDELYGGLGNDTLEGRNGHDLLLGSGGNDVLRGGDGDDDMTGGSGADDFSGSSGNDTMRADDDAADTGLNGGAGIDTAYVDAGLDPPAYGTENVISA